MTTLTYSALLSLGNIDAYTTAVNRMPMLLALTESNFLQNFMAQE